VEPDLRDEVVDFVHKWSSEADMPRHVLVGLIGISRSKFYQWRKRYGSPNGHNGHVCRDHWLLAQEKHAIIDYARVHPMEGYRRLAYMMMDQDIVAVSPATVYRVLKPEGLLNPWTARPGLRGKGFSQPTRPHEHWHTDITHINVSGTYYYLCSVVDGYSRAVIDWTLGESMKQAEVQMLLQRAHEKHPDTRTRLISDNGPQFVAKEFKQLIRQFGMSHVRTSLYYPQSNGKIERWHGSLKNEAIRRKIPLSLEDGRRIIGNYVHHYNNIRLHSAVGYVTPEAMLEGRQTQIHQSRDEKLEAARERRRQQRLTPGAPPATNPVELEKRKQALEESNLRGISSSSVQPEQPADAGCILPEQRLGLQNA
jgi:transposase InsO family protein